MPKKKQLAIGLLSTSGTILVLGVTTVCTIVLVVRRRSAVYLLELEQRKRDQQEEARQEEAIDGSVCETGFVYYETIDEARRPTDPLPSPHSRHSVHMSTFRPPSPPLPPPPPPPPPPSLASGGQVEEVEYKVVYDALVEERLI
jgi:hypothetical protein